MSSTSGRSAKFVSQLLKSTKKGNAVWSNGTRELATILHPDGERDEPDWDDPNVREILAGVALTLSPTSRSCRSIVKAFRAADLDPRNPLSWRWLLEIFCVAYFGEAERGAPKKWDTARYCQLLEDFDRISAKNHASERQIWKLLCEQPKYKMSNGKLVSRSHLEKMLKKAKDPGTNKRLSLGVEETIAVITELYKSRQQPWSDEDENKLRATLIKRNLKSICEGWRSLDPSG